MKEFFSAGMLEATRLTKAGRLGEATTLLQRILAGTAGVQEQNASPTIDGVVDVEDDDLLTRKALPRGTDTIERPAAAPRMAPWHDRSRGEQPAPRARFDHGRFQTPGVAPAIPNGAQFLAGTFSNQAGTRPYKLYVPSGYRPGTPVPLIVMLHGCTQSPDDFAAGTRMNEAAERHTCMVAWPGQTNAANMQKCWNWFNEKDQQRDGGEPSLIAGITRQVTRDYAIDPLRVYVAGLSAGAAAAAIMGNAYPDLFAAIGVHSGLACGVAHDVPSALAAMRSGGDGRTRARSDDTARIVPAIIFHGDLDKTVNPRNADAVAAQSAGATTPRMRTEKGQTPGGHSFTRTLYANEDGVTVIEQWTVHGARHAWIGGSSAGSFTDPAGPDATTEMLRFFLEHPHPDPMRSRA